jgi:hypothetical protein
MDTSVDRARVGLASAKTRHGLTEAKLRELVPGERAYKVSDGGNGLYVVVSPSGSRSFRYDYRLGGRSETLTIGRHEPVARHAQRSHLAYGMDVTLEEAIHNRILGGRSASSSSMRSSRSRWVSCSISSKHVHPSRDGSAEPLSQATLNRTISGAVDRINQDRAPDQEPFLPPTLVGDTRPGQRRSMMSIPSAWRHAKRPSTSMPSSGGSIRPAGTTMGRLGKLNPPTSARSATTTGLCISPRAVMDRTEPTAGRPSRAASAAGRAVLEAPVSIKNSTASPLTYPDQW